MRPRQVFVATIVVLLTLLGAYLVTRLFQIIILTTLAFIFAAAISPAVALLEKRMPRVAAIFVVYIILLTLIGILIAFITQPLISQAGSLVSNAPDLLEAAQSQLQQWRADLGLPGGANLDFAGYLQQIFSRAPALAAGVFNVTLGVITGVGGAVVILVIAFYWLLERPRIEATWLSLVPVRRHAEVLQALHEVEVKSGGYVRGIITLATIMSAASYIGLRFFLDMPYALVLALIVGLAEFVPLAGPFLAAVPAVLVAFAQSPGKALIVAIFYLILQQVENNLLVPSVMRRSVGLSPLTTLLSVLAGATLLGVVGALLAVPVASATSVVLHHTLFRNHPDHSSTETR